MATRRYHYRITGWYDEQTHCTQVSACLLDPDTWEPLAEVTEHVGPFDDVDQVVLEALLAARNLAEGQFAGQLRLIP